MQPEGGKGKAQLGVLGHDPHVAGHGQAKAGANGVAARGDAGGVKGKTGLTPLRSPRKELATVRTR